MRRANGSLVALGVVACLLGMGCATAGRTGSDDQLLVESEPSGASIFVNETFAGVSPRLVPMPRDHTIKIRCSLAGYRESTTNVYREIAPAAAFDSPIFAVLDEMSGAAYRLQRKTLFVELTPIAASRAGQPNP